MKVQMQVLSELNFFELLLAEFNKRLLEGENLRVPRRGNNFNYTLFGMVIGHSILHGGPGFYYFQPWVFEFLHGNVDQEHLLQYISKAEIPINASSNDIVALINNVDSANSQEELDQIIDNNIQIINCSKWDPLVRIETTNKSELITELIYEELVLKRHNQIKYICEGLTVTGFMSYIQLVQQKN